MDAERKHQLIRAKLLVQRLGHLSADSIWAHRASGVRASLDKALARIEAGQLPENAAWFDQLVELGFEIIKEAAKEVPDTSQE